MRRAAADRNNSEATAESPKSDYKMGFSHAELAPLTKMSLEQLQTLPCSSDLNKKYFSL
jgi:hypothetical protein